jgi:hypothetical protein
MVYHCERPQFLLRLFSLARPSSGSKAALITRIKHVESRQNSANSPTLHKRDSSTANHSRSLATSPSASGLTLGVKLPDLSAPQELPGPQIVNTSSHGALHLS